MKTLRLPARTCLLPYGFGCRFPVGLLRFVSAEALPAHVEVALRAWDDGSAGVPLAGISRTGARVGSLRFPGDPSHASALLQDPDRADRTSPCSGLADAAPGTDTPKASAGT
jgi:hypothetical protein